MTPERWQQIREVFEHAELLDADDRARYLGEACVTDSELRNEVESLLRYEDRADTAFLKTPAADLLKPLLEEEPRHSRLGRRLGVYQIVNEIGRGGMGEVYRAARADGHYDKQVAIKLVRVGLDASFVLQGFRHERQILASLDHPNIAGLLDGGTTDDGIPYLVMELIEGVRIDDYCERHKLSVTKRLQLFRQVCGAVQYAHGRLVIHRDIKPSNILVTEDGVPKLLDFGIAKILDPAADREMTLVRAMTPEYASPEQIRGEAVTTSTDVYSLGVVLYRLLTGRSPYGASASAPHELPHAITEMEPQRPSHAAFSGGSARSNGAKSNAIADGISSTHETSPAKLRRRLAGDIDNILLMALRKEAERRYGSVEKLAEDISRHLEGLPVTAGKGSWIYRAGKFSSRHRTGVLAAALALITLIVGCGLIVRESGIARAERQRADKRFNDVRKLANSLIFDVNDSMADLPGNTPARKILLDRAVEYLDKLAQDAAGNSDLERELAWGYQRLAVVQGNSAESNLGQVSASETSNRKALALFEAVAKANPDNILDQLNLAMVHRLLGQANVYYPQGRPEIDKAIAITDRFIRTDGTNAKVRSERSLEYQTLGYSQDSAGDRTGAAESFRRALAIKQDILRSDPDYHGIREGLAKATVQLGYQLALAGLLKEAQEQIERGVAAYESLVKQGTRPDVIRDLAASRLRQGVINLLRGGDSAARGNFNLALEAVRSLSKADPENVMLRSDILSLEFEQGRLLVLAGRFTEAAAALQRTIGGFEKLHLEGDTGPGNGLMFTWLGEAQYGTRNYGESLRSYQKAIAALERDAELDDSRCGMAADYVRIGRTLAKLSRPQDAAAACRKALEKAASLSLGPKDIPALYPIAEAYAELGYLSTALARKTRDPIEQIRLCGEACTSYQKSFDMWRQIRQPATFCPNGYPVGDLRGVGKLLAGCRARLRGVTR
jgi:serine/threonine protein kinase